MFSDFQTIEVDEASFDLINQEQDYDAEVCDDLFEVDIAEIDASIGKFPILETSSSKKQKKLTLQELSTLWYNDPSSKHTGMLFERLYYGLRAYAYKIVKDLDVANDMVVDSFVKAMEKHDYYNQDKSQVSTWIYRICRNNCLGYLYLKKRLPIMDKDLSDCYDSQQLKQAEFNLSSESSQHYVFQSPSVLTNYSKDQILREFTDASIYEINRMDDKSRFVLTEKLLKGTKIKDIAEILNTHQSNVKNVLYKGKIVLAETLKSKYKFLYEMYMDTIGVQNEMAFS